MDAKKLWPFLWKGAVLFLVVAVIAGPRTSDFLRSYVVGPVLTRVFEQPPLPDASEIAVGFIQTLREAPECAEFADLLRDAGKGPRNPHTMRALVTTHGLAKERGCVNS